MPVSGRPAPTNARGVGWLRFWLGGRQLDRLFGVRGRREFVQALRAATPEVDGEAVAQGWELVRARERRYPKGVATRRLGKAIWAFGALVGILTGVLLLAALIGFLVSLVAGWFERYPLGTNPMDDAIGHWFLLPGAIGLVVMVLIAAVAGTVEHFGYVQEGRHAVRWAADRKAGLPGAPRGIPDSSPFGRFSTIFLGAALVLWCIGVIFAIAWVVYMADEDWDFSDGFTQGLTAVIAGLLVLAWLASRAYGLTNAAEGWASQHLFLLTNPVQGPRVDAATAVAERFLLVPAAAQAWEWVVYPDTVRLSEPAQARRRQSVEQDPNARVLAGGEGKPLSVLYRLGDYDLATLEGYLGGAHVADATVNGAKVQVWAPVAAAVALPDVLSLHGQEGPIEAVELREGEPLPGTMDDLRARIRPARQS